MRRRLNQPAWLIDVCRQHHNAVTDAVGEALERAKASGWVLPEYRDGVQVDAELVPVLARHAPGPVLFDNEGGWTVA